MDDAWAQIISAGFWPVVVLIGLLMFQRPLRDKLTEAAQLRVGNAELITRQLVGALDLLERELRRNQQADVTEQNKELRERIDRLARKDPHRALAELRPAIDQRCDEIALTFSERERVNDPQLTLWWHRLFEVHQITRLPRDLLPAMYLFAEYDEAVAAGQVQLTKAQTREVVRIGLLVHQHLAAVPLPERTVIATDIPVYADEELTIRRDVRTVALRTTEPDGSSRIQIRPVVGHYEIGDIVTHEWDTTQEYPTTWCRDLVTDQPRRAWGEAYTFVGQVIGHHEAATAASE